MRELCRAGGTVVAAVVAVLEKQQQALSAPPPSKNSLSASTPDDNFQSAVKDFDSVAEDVERIVVAQRKCQEDDSSSEDDSESSGEHVLEGLETIAEEDRNTSSALSYKGLDEDSSPEDDSTLKLTNTWQNDSTSDSSSSSSSLPRSSTRCDDDFQWIRKEMKMEEVAAKPPIGRSRTPRRDKPAPGSLDRRRHQRVERDQKSRSTHVPKSPPRLDDFAPCQNWCCSENYAFENFHRRHERMDPQRYGSSPMLMDRGSHPDLFGCRHEMMGCCGYHVAPPCCFYGERGYHWTPAPFQKSSDQQDEKFRKLQYEKDNLQLQVQVLTEQIEAQTDKIADLEKLLMERKQHLSETEEKLQREVLSRSSLETQKLEMMSIVSELKLQQAALERENLELRSQFNNNGDIKKPPLGPRMVQTSTPVHHSSNQALRMSPSPSPVTLTGSSPRRDDIPAPKTPPANYKRQIDLHYGSLPRQQFISNGSSISVVDSNANPKKGVAFAETEKIIEGGSGESPQSPTLQFNRNKGIKKIFGRMKRSGSGNLEELPGIGEFQRGGVRATAAARLGWSEPQLTVKPDKPFAEWDTENICDWLQDLSLDQYIPEAKRWVKSGQQLQEASITDIEKELNIKNPLHKKKLQLALIDTQENGSSDPYLTKAGQLDMAWVLRWLDDTGLPQHKENFLINRVDGRVLHRLTIDDLALLHVTSLLHVASIKRGIQVLRENNYEPGCLQRRSSPEDPPQPTPKIISLWTTHRVMEWLKAVDLAEYAPNLRGAGVHGGLMVYETKFTAELLATLLSIPPGKTLLRRHLKTHFNELLGKEIIQEKREAESTMGYIPLTPSSKLKVAKKSQFSLKRKKSKGEADYGDLVCPLNSDKQSGELNGSAPNMGMMKTESLRVEDVSHHVEQKLVRSSPASIANSPVPQRHV
ncbi:liprin-beta-2 isoform X2 [Tribolium castaneum]|uniref:liprin-beta-2 isoform X2 n=1 Tax=Tribolium castaneum TaxID=7070 RepID=UPI00046C0E1B|nr:PREDICTED: liprin-beta-2 isoform X2 [Tribolium castaneum]|eukprot:XP_008192368.1 PREDICTED: liprin-beta-2 isoform X2 [Tribolium castaneum]